MSKNIINVGASANDRQGDSLRTAFIKINGNFDELYSTVEGFDLTNSIPTLTGNTGKYLSNNGSSLVWNTIDIPTDLSELTDTTNILAGLDATVFIGEDAPPSPVQGKLWYETESGRTYIYYDTSWVDANPKGASGSTLPNQNTNAGKFLTTDGSNLSWATVSGGGSSDRLVSGSAEVVLNSTGLTQFPAVSDESVFIQGSEIGSTNSGIGVTATNNIVLTTDALGTPKFWQFGTDGILELPNTGSIKQNNSWTRTTDCILFASEPAVDVIWSSTVDYISSVKLTIQLETNEIGDATGWHSQVCEAVIASRGYANGTTGYGDPAMIVYGVTYTSTVPLATFTVQRNPTTKMIEVVATRTAATDSNLDFRIHSVEMSTKD